MGAGFMDDNLGLLEPGSAALPPPSDDRRATIPSLRQARLLVLVAAVMWSTSGFFVKSPYLAGWSGPRLSCAIRWATSRQAAWR